MGHMCKKCTGIYKLVTGALILVNAFLWPRWLDVDGWVAFLGLLLVIFGFIKLVVPNKCPTCNAMGGKAPAKGKK
jgi:uncharacterized membrane protein